MAQSEHLSDKGKATLQRLFGTSRRPSASDNTDPEFQKLSTDFVLNGMYSREVISPAVRQLLAVACLTALYRPDQLRSHIGAALRLNKPEEVQEAILQAIVYGGWPSAMTALRIFEEVRAEMEKASGT